MNRQRGLTIVELLVSLTIVLIVMGAATTAYLKLVRGYKTQSKLSQNYMSNVCGLEMLRYDVEMAGFGLPLSLNAGATYSEAASAGSPSPYDPASINDAPSGVPRAFAQLNNTGAGNSDVLAIKSSVNGTSKKWSMIIAPGGPLSKVKAWGGASLDPVLDFTTGDRFIIVNSAGLLLPDSAGACSYYTFNGNGPANGYYADASALPSPNPQTVHYIYGLDSSAGAHRMPFNRVDYYLQNVPGEFPTSCASTTFTLYRAMIDQATGNRITTPLLDCARDFQVAFGLDTNLDNNVDTWSQNIGAMSASAITTQVREVRVFVLYQEGLGDLSRKPDFRFSGTLNLGDQAIANALDPGNYPANTFQQLSAAALPGNPQLSSFTPSGTERQYRWKVLEMAIKPMNLK